MFALFGFIIYAIIILLARKNGGPSGTTSFPDYANTGNINANNYNPIPGNAADLSTGLHLQVHNSFSHSYSHTQAQIYPPNYIHAQQPPQLPMTQSNQATAMMVNTGTKTKLTVYSSVSVQHQQHSMPPQQHPPLFQHSSRPQREQIAVNNVINQGKLLFSY